MLNSAVHRACFSLPLLVIFPAALQARAQAQTQGKAFEVVSIRQNVSPGGGTPNLTPTPDGFHVDREPLLHILLTAYTPKAGGMFMKNIGNLPDWAERERYNIDARIGDADRAAWNDPKNQPAMLQEMLDAMLADRCKLVIHREMKEVPVFDLVVAKGGVKFTETQPTEPRPTGATLPGGGVMGHGADGATHMYNFSMGTLAALLSEKSDRTVLDKTGLAGRYSFDIHEPAQVAAPSVSPDDGNEKNRLPAIVDVLKSVGLELRPAKEQVEFLVIDHMERPTDN